VESRHLVILRSAAGLENAPAMAAQKKPSAIKFYDRTGDGITIDEVERLATWVSA
jgi:hypothetical protein